MSATTKNRKPKDAPAPRPIGMLIRLSEAESAAITQHTRKIGLTKSAFARTLMLAEIRRAA